MQNPSGNWQLQPAAPGAGQEGLDPGRRPRSVDRDDRAARTRVVTDATEARGPAHHVVVKEQLPTDIQPDRFHVLESLYLFGAA